MAMMLPTKFAAVFVVVLPAIAAQMPLPELRTVPIDAGSVFFVKNNSPQPLNAFLIELVDYPGSAYFLWQDETVAEPIPPKGEKRIQVTNMTVGAVPDYCKIQAAIYADGTTAGIPEKVAQLVDRRRTLLETTRQLIARVEKAQAGGAAKADVIGSLKQWADTLQPVGRGNRNTPAAINQAAARGVIAATAARLDKQSLAESLTMLRGWDRALGASAPAR